MALMRAILFACFFLALTGVSQGKDLATKVDATMDTLSDTPIFKITVSNDSGEYVAVQGVTVALPTDLFPTDFDNDTAFDLPNGQSHEMQVPGLKPKRRALFSRAKGYDAFVVVRYRTGSSGTRDAPQAKVTLSPLAPWWVVLIGAAAGVVTILLFRLLLAFVRHPAAQAPPFPKTEARPVAPDGGTAAGMAPAQAPAAVVTPASATPRLWPQFVLGWLVVFMAVMLFRFTSTQFPDLPITVNVKDIYGGFALGLVFQPLVHFFSRLE
jgi:hypothetical protein